MDEVTKIETDITPTYPISKEDFDKILESLRTHGIFMSDNVLSWSDPTDYGLIKPADPGWFLARGIDLRMHINPMSVGESDETTRFIWERLQKWFKQHAENGKIRDDSRDKFVFMILNRSKKEVSIQDIDFATLTRLAVLSSHLQYHGRRKKKNEKEKEEKRKENTEDNEKGSEQKENIENKKEEKKEEREIVRTNYIMRSDVNGRVRATKKDIRKILNLPSSTWEHFWSTCMERGYITGDDENGYQMVDIFRYGRLDRKKSAQVQKLYTDAFKCLYTSGRVVGPKKKARGLKNSDHKLIGMLIYLAAYHMYPKTNELVANPHEIDQFQLIPLRETGIANALGFRTENGHAARDIGRLRDLTFRLPGDDHEMYCLIRVEAGRGRGNVRYIINPALIYAGDKQNYPTMMGMQHWYVETKENDKEK